MPTQPACPNDSNPVRPVNRLTLNTARLKINAVITMLIQNVPKVKLPEDESPPDDFSELEVTGKRLRITLPMASEHPKWESTVMREPLMTGTKPANNGTKIPTAI